MKIFGDKVNTIKTNVALGCVGGKIAIFNELYCERKLLTNEHQSKENPFIQFINAKNLPELMISIDALVEKMGMTDFITALFPQTKPTATDSTKAKVVCRYFESKTPTRTTLQRTIEALEAWNIGHAKQKDIVLTNDPDASPMYIFTFLEDIVKAKEDLANISMTMAWLLEKTDFQSLSKVLTHENKKNQIRSMGEKEPETLYDYYKQLGENTGNLFDSFGLDLNPLADLIHSCNENDARSNVTGYVRCMFNLLLSDERKIINYDLSTGCFFNTILSAAWSFFADGLNETNGIDPICVCKHCHRFFQQKRSTKQYCSDSCRVMALRDKI